MKANMQIQVEALIEDVQTAKTYITNYVTGNKLEASFYRYFIAGSLESANSSILASCDHFKEVVWKKIRVL